MSTPPCEAFANEVALLCESMGVDAWEIRELINARPDRHMLKPGTEVGGHCLPKDSWLLHHGVHTYGKAMDHGELPPMRLIPLAREINDAMPAHMLDLIEEELGNCGIPLRGAKVAILGVSYLENADETRNTPAAPLVTLLLERGAEAAYHDPNVPTLRLGDGETLESVALTDDALAGADCVFVHTAHAAVDWGRVRALEGE